MTTALVLPTPGLSNQRTIHTAPSPQPRITTAG
jgi:hypothetical protein